MHRGTDSLKILTLSHSDIDGGAARAAYRIHHALRRHGVESIMWVDYATAGDWTVRGPVGVWRKGMVRLREPLARPVTRLLKSGNPIRHSPAVIPSRWARELNAAGDVDVAHLHWVNREMLSIADIGRIRKPVVWTLHDMWAFCGAEHCTEEFRWREGYLPQNRPPYESGFDLNRWTWRRKRKAWRRPLHLVTPSRWLSQCVRESALMHDWPVTVIHNALDTEVWRPVDKAVARGLLRLPADVPLLLFGAMGGGPHKGFDLLRQALEHLRGQVKDLQLVSFGQLRPRTPDDLGFPVHYPGFLHDDMALCVMYSAADVIVIPSRLDNLVNTGVEALACGTPVAAFGACGMPDIVNHRQTGYLARAFDAEELARGIEWMLADRTRLAELGARARQDAVARFSYPVVARQYLQLYETVVSDKA